MPPSTSGGKEDIAKRTILLVEDDRDTRAALAEVLGEEGYLVVATSNGHEAMAYLRGNPRPDCIVMDLWMPVMDGWSLAAQLREPEAVPIPIVIVTGAEPHWGYPNNARHILRKPLAPQALVALIADALRNNSA